MARRRRYLAWLAVAAAVVGAAAAVLATRPEGPPPPAQVLYGVDECAECGMVLSDARSAAQMLTDHRAAKFCDVGCLVVYQLRHHAGWDGVRAAYVPDWNTRQWLDARRAWWVSTHHKTPMLYGLVTLGDRTEAERMAQEQGGQVMTYDQVAALDLLREEARR